MTSQKNILSPISVLLLVLLGLVALLGNTRAPADGPVSRISADSASQPAPSGLAIGQSNLGFSS